MDATDLPLPRLQVRTHNGIDFFTDEALFRASSVRFAFTGRVGGVSAGPYASLNLGSRVLDDPCAVERNRALLAEALGAEALSLIVPNQVHGTELVEVPSADVDAVARARALAEAGSDGIAVEVAGVAALLCFADCVPVVLASPTGRFAVVHAGWRGAVAGIASKAAALLAARDAGEGGDVPAAAARLNAYLGPHIGACCFETGADVRERFVAAFGEGCAPDGSHVDLSAALALDLTGAGLRPDRIADAQACTSCDSSRYFSYRASGGTCGRQGALAFRVERKCS